MANYNEQSVTGSEWQRANKVTIRNPVGGIPSITFDEEKVTSLSNGTNVNTPVGAITESMTDPMTAFDLLHPETNAVIGSATYLDLHVILYSLYMHLAAVRDAAPPAPAE